jgi:hypothetical protein
MPSNIEQTTVTPGKAADLVGVEVYTIRRWCDWHKEHLSAGASPGPSALRRLTMRDVEVLKTVRDLRGQGQITIAINEQLAGLSFPEIDSKTTPDDQPDTMLESSVTTVTSSQQAPAPLVVVEASQAIEAIQVQIQAIQQAQRAGWWWLVAGIVIGLGLAVVFELAAIVASRVH